MGLHDMKTDMYAGVEAVSFSSGDSASQVCSENTNETLDDVQTNYQLMPTGKNGENIFGHTIRSFYVRNVSQAPSP